MGLTWSTVPNICGLPLRVGTLWIAEIFTILSLLSVWYSTLMIREPIWGMLSLECVPIVWLIACVLQATWSIWLVAGVYMNLSEMVIPWVIYNIIIMVLCVIGLAILVLMQSDLVLKNQKCLVTMLFTLTIAFVALRYIITGVYSFYKELKNSRARMAEVWTRDNGETQSLTKI